jgi:hypothetical protein
MRVGAGFDMRYLLRRDKPFRLKRKVVNLKSLKKKALSLF